jgi:hypothetical protein
MVVDSRRVVGRRKLRFENLDQVVEDAAALVADPHVATLGNWSFDHLLSHLAVAIEGSLEGIDVQAPWFVRLFAPLIKRRALDGGITPGVRVPKMLEARSFPAGGSPATALERLRKAVARADAGKMTARHPFFGMLTHDEWLKFHLRHAELHLSFVVSGAEPR